MNKKTDKRLLASLDYIDDKFTERAAKRIKTRPVGMTGGVSKKRMIKYVALLAACMILLGAAIPIATSLLNKLPEVIDPSASNDDTTAPETQLEEEKPEEYFSDSYFTGTLNVYKYEGQFVYYVKENSGYYRIVKYNPEIDAVSSVCLNTSCSHTYDDCPVASPLGWDLLFDGIGDWLIIRFSTPGGTGKGPDDTKLCAYNLKTGEARTVLEKNQTGNIVKYASGFLTFEEKAYILIVEKDISDPQNIISKGYITCYDPKTDENVYMCEQPEGLGFIGISNKRFFYSEKLRYNWSSDHNGKNLQKEETCTFLPVAVSGTYAYDFSFEDDDNNPATMNVYDLVTDSKFVIDFGNTLRDLRVLEDKLLYVIYKSEDKTGPTELWVCDKRGENRRFLLEFENNSFTPLNCLGDFIICQSTTNGISKYYIFNVETCEFKEIPNFEVSD